MCAYAYIYILRIRILRTQYREVDNMLSTGFTGVLRALEYSFRRPRKRPVTCLSGAITNNVDPTVSTLGISPVLSQAA